MTKMLKHILSEGQTITMYEDGQPIQTFTVPANKSLLLTATEYRLFTQNKQIEVVIDGVKKLDYTVPQGRVIVVESDLRDEEIIL